jgi:hypothetical protein
MEKVSNRQLSAFFGEGKRAIVYKNNHNSYFVEMYEGERFIQKIQTVDEISAEDLAENFVESKSGPELLQG